MRFPALLPRLAVVLGIFFGLLAATPGLAARHALLVGVKSYPNLPANQQLEGPVNDVQSVKQRLVRRFGFPEQNIIVLTDAAATRRAILDGLERLADRIGTGDTVFIYFSGHGTSAYDEDNRRLGIEPYTGALIPADFRAAGDAATMLNRLILGVRDIQPVVHRMERKDAHVFGVFDTCYSGYSFRAMPRGRAKQVDMSWDSILGGQATFSADTRKVPPYPYRQAIYLSAASDREKARDITQAEIDLGMETVNGQPHGAMTNALLMGLDGKADTNGDGRITYSELHGFTRDRVSKSFGHNPKLLHPDNRRDLVRQPVFRARSASLNPPGNGGGSGETASRPDISSELRVKTRDLSAELRRAVGKIDGVILTDGPHDLLVKPEYQPRTVQRRQAYAIYLGNGALLTEVGERALVDRVRLQVRAMRLAGLRYSGQPFNVFLDIPGNKGVFLEGEPFGFHIRAEKKSYFLFINIDPAGTINVIYPFHEREMTAREDVVMPNAAEVVPPHFGAEYLKVFAFSEKPAALKTLMGASFSPTDPKFDTLMAMVSSPKNAAEAVLQVQTAPASEAGGNEAP